MAINNELKRARREGLNEALEIVTKRADKISEFLYNREENYIVSKMNGLKYRYYAELNNRLYTKERALREIQIDILEAIRN